MKVIKKDGRIQEFNIEKIKLTLERVSDEINEPLTQSDIDNLARAIQKAILAAGKEHMHSFEIHRIVVDQLRTAGFDDIARAYGDYQKKR